VERPDLRLVGAPQAEARSPAALAVGAAILVAAIVATLAGADASRRPIDAAADADAALAATLSSGQAGPAHRAVVLLRDRLRANPLDAGTRTILASLLVESGDGGDRRDEAARQALAAVRLAPTDEWIGSAAARVLARCGKIEAALEEAAHIFAYAPDDGAAVLAAIEPFVPQGRLDEGLPASARAWLAWSIRLRALGREDEADAWLARLLAQWPGDLPALTVAASAAASRDRIAELVHLVPPSLSLPETPEAAALRAFRARSKAVSGDAAGSEADARRAVELSHGDPWVLTLAGDAVAERSPALARDWWTRALYRDLADPSSREAAVWVRAKLARLDEREGRAADALRLWRSILDDRPDDPEARHRAAELTGAAAGR
jgi:tetratricopeptide (TPR) repeat protein